ncbi:PEP-CTERM sorting domain-containing protein [Pontiella agarivorans]|uniref:PEP-CTERM sorting domain-containing protein n=1 Tax=Pontiella agarivorans TaxID=3038953 RepID=A0ABU5MY92_9BACT|nr:PEP-CTERM sorting domain-containing protein [Pontiella agarivorans]MDZ8119041.1 PEP-CTERM sorting domain-containing protein [Pontiella agarivorans]
MKQIIYILSVLAVTGAAQAGIIDAASGAATLFGDTEIRTDHTGYTGAGFTALNNRDNSGFTLAADTAFTNIVLRYAAASTNPGEFHISIEETGSPLSTAGDTVFFAKTASYDDWTTISINLSGESGDVFHFAWADTSNNGGVNVDYVNFQAIPEPATAGLIALVGGGLFFIRRLMM